MIAPRIRSVPPASGSLGAEAVQFVREVAGINLDAEQQMVLEESLGIRQDGKWAAFEAAVNEGRQNGKNEIALGRELAGMFLFGDRLLIHSAHEFKTSTEHQRRVEEIVQDTPDLHKRVKPRGYKHSHGEESIELRTGQRIRFMTRTKGGGRGHTGDLVVLDEAMILPAAMLGALMPTLSARSVLGNPQLWYLFTAVDQTLQEHGIVAAKLRERALAGGDPSLAYFEWSAAVGDPRKDNPERLPVEQLADRRLWAQANPALGVRISEEHVANELRSMGARTFAVERLGVGDWPSIDEERSVADLEAWLALADVASKPRNPVCFAFDVTPLRSWSSIAVAGLRSDGTPHVEVVEHREGTGWVAPRLAELVAKWKPAGVAYGSRAPSAALVPDLELRKVRPLHEMTVGESAAACGRLFDAIEQGTIRHLGEMATHGSALNTAVARAARKDSGDGGWLWARSSSTVDISPLWAVTLALYELSLRKPKSAPMVAFV